MQVRGYEMAVAICVSHVPPAMLISNSSCPHAGAVESQPPSPQALLARLLAECHLPPPIAAP